MLAPLRAEANALLSRADVRRKPFLRRSLNDGFLLTTDLPCAASEQETCRVAEAFAAQGWRVLRTDGLLELDHALDAPADAPLPPFSEKLSDVHRLASVLSRHTEGTSDGGLLRGLAKAEESGTVKLNAWCAAVYHACAASLRRHEALPSGLLPYLTQILREEE